jgi:hypothetical protein
MQLAEMLLRVTANIRRSATLKLEAEDVRGRAQDTKRIAAVLRRFSKVERTQRAEGGFR